MQNPLFGNPSLFIILISLLYLCSLGFSFPSCERGVTVPISIKLKFSFKSPDNASPFLSKPAAKPKGLDNL